jgi:hypothetical protein
MLGLLVIYSVLIKVIFKTTLKNKNRNTNELFEICQKDKRFK